MPGSTGSFSLWNATLADTSRITNKHVFLTDRAGFGDVAGEAGDCLRILPKGLSVTAAYHKRQ